MPRATKVGPRVRVIGRHSGVRFPGAAAGRCRELILVHLGSIDIAMDPSCAAINAHREKERAAASADASKEVRARPSMTCCGIVEAFSL